MIDIIALWLTNISHHNLYTAYLQLISKTSARTAITEEKIEMETIAKLCTTTTQKIAVYLMMTTFLQIQCVARAKVSFSS